jgi:dihydropteroate synthase
MSYGSTQTRLLCGSRVLDLSKPHVMGILNVTPDSFSDGGSFNVLDKALTHAQEMVVAGATLIDIGGESTRPGAPNVSVSEELSRVIPVVEAVTKELDVIVSIDTSSAEVIREAARAGAGLINDVRALRQPGALRAVAETSLPVCLMHMQGEPGTMQQNPHYENIVEDVIAFLEERISACELAGINRDRILLDPGFGFAKNLDHNLLLFQQMPKLLRLGLPLLVGVSRKSMIGAVLNRPVHERLWGSLALAALAVAKGARIIRVHDVEQTVDIIKMISAVEQA